MNPILKNVLGLLAGLLVGSMINGAIIALGPSIIPAPDGAVIPTGNEGFEESIRIAKGNMDLYGPMDWLIPFLAHALGVLVGALLAVKICATHKKTFAVLVGVVFLIMGAVMSYMLDFPMPFSAIDLIGAYIPMALLGWMIGRDKAPDNIA